MGRNRVRRLSREELEADQIALNAIRDLPDYQASNPDYGLERLNALDAALREAQQQERRAVNVLEAARDASIAAALALHDAALGAKTQVVAQYGPNADAVQALGLKKKSERRIPRRSTPSTA